MKYFKNRSLMQLYSVSDKTVRNWIAAALEDKNDLQLYQTQGRYFVLDSIHNDTVIKRLVAKGRKYRNRRAQKILEPKTVFYEQFNNNQVLEIVHSIQMHREVPQHFRYVGRGGLHWDAYLKKLRQAGAPNILTSQIEGLRLFMPYILSIADRFKRIDIVDLGTGNGIAVKEFLASLLAEKKTVHYTGIDISRELLDITEKNLKSWFRDKIPARTYMLNFTDECFGQFLRRASPGEDTPSTLNVVLCLGSSIPNFPEPGRALRNIYRSMGPEDILITSLKPDSTESRRFFDFNLDFDASKLPPHTANVLDLLNIQNEYYDVEQFFDQKTTCRLMRINLRTNLQLQFTTDEGKITVVLEKGEKITLWRSWHWSEKEVLDIHKSSGFDTLQLVRSRDNASLILMTLPHQMFTN